MVVRTESLSSSWLASATYDSEAETLTIRTTSGKEYTHNGVPESELDALASAPSPGQYWNAVIKVLYP